MNAVPKDALRKGAREFALDFLNAAGGDKHKARAMALNSTLPQDVIDEVLFIGWQAILADLDVTSRRALIRELQDHRVGAECRRVSSRTDSDARAGRVAALSIFDTFRLNGKRSGDLTPDELRHMIAEDSKKAKSYDNRVKFLTLVLKRLRPGKRVRDCWNETDYRDLVKRYNP